MAGKTWPPKDPEEVLPYGFNWTPRDLGEDTIDTTTAVVVQGDVTIDSHDPGTVPKANEGQGTVTWLRGGTAGEACVINLHIVTTPRGMEFEQTVTIKIKER